MHYKVEVKTEKQHFCAELMDLAGDTPFYTVTFWDGDQMTAAESYTNLDEAKQRYRAFVSTLYVELEDTMWQAIRKRSA